MDTILTLHAGGFNMPRPDAYAQMTLDVKVQDEVFAQMQNHFTTTELVEITAAIATYNMVARFLVALGVTPEA